MYSDCPDVDGMPHLYSDADHTNSRLVLDMFVCHVLRIRGGQLGYRCILLLLLDDIRCRGLREIVGERKREDGGYILKHQRRNSSRNALLVVSGRGCTVRSMVSGDYHCCWQLHMHGVVLDPLHVFPLRLEKDLNGIIVGVEEKSREHRPSAVVNEDTI